MPSDTGERINKALAKAGVASRRGVEDLIKAGRVRVDGRPAELGERVGAGSTIEVDGRKITLQRPEDAARHVIAYHKPEGEICTANDPRGRRTVFDGIGDIGQGRWISVGRLDLNTSGLLLLTTDGELANRLMHPSYEIKRVYRCRVRGELSQSRIKRLLSGVDLDGQPARFLSLEPDGRSTSSNTSPKSRVPLNVWCTVTLAEGRNREVRRLFEAVDLTVSRLVRTQYGPITLSGQLARGDWEELSENQVSRLAKAVSLNQT